MKKGEFFLFLFMGLSGMAQSRFTSIVEETEYVSTANDLRQFDTYNFTPLISGLEVSYTFGTIGNEYKRIRIKMLDVVKDEINPYVYHIKGKTKVGNNLEDFEGTVTLQHIRKIRFRVSTDEIISLPPKYEGVVSGIYEFREPKSSDHAGVFTGSYQGMFQIAEDDKVYYNDLDLYRDNYINNVYIGFWTDYQTNAVKICKWGDFRVPDVPPEFDLGAGEFSPNEKYNSKGWSTYHEAFFQNNKSAMEVEEGAWWE